MRKNKMKFGLLQNVDGEYRLLTGFVADEVEKLLPMVSKDKEEAIDKGLLGTREAMDVLDSLGYKVSEIPEYVAEIIADPTQSQQFFDGSYAGISIFEDDFSEENFSKKINFIEAQLKSQFVKDALSDWISDMDNTDWEAYEQHPERWKRIIYYMSDEEIVEKLDSFKRDVEPVAKEEGYVPGSSEPDIRTWSESLIHYLG
jgi:hypothetical protein